MQMLYIEIGFFKGVIYNNNYFFGVKYDKIYVYEIISQRESIMSENIFLDRW